MTADESALIRSFAREEATNRMLAAAARAKAREVGIPDAEIAAAVADLMDERYAALADVDARFAKAVRELCPRRHAAPASDEREQRYERRLRTEVAMATYCTMFYQRGLTAPGRC